MIWIGRALSRLTSLAAIVGMVCVALMMAHVTADVAMRYLFNAPIGGTITIVSHYYMVILGFVSLAVAEERDAHISVEVVADLLPPLFTRPLAALASGVALFVFTMMTQRTWEEALRKMASGSTIEQGTMSIPLWPSYFALPIGCGLMVLVAGYKLVIAATGAPSGLATDPVPAAERQHD